MVIHVAKEKFAERRCRSRRSSRSFPGRRSWFSKCEDKRLVSFEREFEGNRRRLPKVDRRGGNGCKPDDNAGDTPATTAKLSQDRRSVREDAPLQNQLSKG